jgi:hypothetical protein
MPETTSPRSYTSDHAENGYTARAIGRNVAHSGVTLAELAAAALDDLTDGDLDNTRAIRALSRISEIGAQLADTGWEQADGNLAAAKSASKKLVTDGGKS